MLLPLTWVSKYEQSCLVEHVRLSLPRIGEKPPRALSHPAFRTEAWKYVTIFWNAKSVWRFHFFLCNMCHWPSCGEETTDLAWAQSSLSKIIRQSMFVCLRTSSGFTSGKSCSVRHLLEKYCLAGASSIHRSVSSHRYSSFGGRYYQVRPFIWRHQPIFEKKDRAGDFSACIVGGIRLGEHLIQQQDNERARDTAQGTASRSTSLGSAPLEVQYYQPSVCCLLKTIGRDDCLKAYIPCSPAFVPTADSEGKHSFFG